ncbi:MAG: AraC family transcriptional regulator [Thalassobaculaceae bacterium]|nr:AraC family transcriptional regulator [Thalassobaculaceae bacterium]
MSRREGRRSSERSGGARERLETVGHLADPDYALKTRQVSAPGDPVEGRVIHQNFASGISLHVTDAIEMADLQIPVTLQPGLNILLLLEGAVDSTLDGTALRFNARRGPVGRIWSLTRPTTRVRSSARGRYVRKVNINIPLTWFEERFGADKASAASQELEAFLRAQLSLKEWEPSPSAIRYAEDLLALEQKDGVLTHIAAERDLLGVMYDALSRFRSEEARAVPRHLRSRDVVRAQTARELILRNLDDGLHLPDIAKQTGMSVSTLQRVFRDCYGQTVMEFARVHRLERARDLLERDGLSVGEAAHRAGYSSPANFATAFHREFGYPPSQVKERARRAALMESGQH